MKNCHLLTVLGVSLFAVAPLGNASAQTAYGYSTLGQLFSFNVASPGTRTNIGTPLTFVPEGIDFNPQNSVLFALDVGVTTSSLYTINLLTGLSTQVGAGFATAGSGLGGNGSTMTSYNLAGASGYGFDFNPKTVQGDGSIRIRLTSQNGDDLRLNAATGAVANVDPTLTYNAGDVNSGSPSVVGSAYSNNVAGIPGSGTTTLFNVSSQSDSLLTQTAGGGPNFGVQVTVGSLGAGVDVIGNAGFDIFTDGGGVNSAFLAAQTATSGGDYSLFSVNTTNGTATSLGSLGSDFAGDLAIAPVPEPGTLAMLGVGAGFGLLMLRRRNGHRESAARAER